MSAIRYMGNHDVAAEGKFMFEILYQLRNFGVGRMVTKSEWLQKFPKQPSYIRIERVKPGMDRWMWRGTVWGQWVYRGKHLGVYEFSQELDRSDWKLIHKHEEEEFAKSRAPPLESIKLPTKIPFPPLMRYQLQKEKAKEGETFNPETMIGAKHVWDKEHEMLSGLVEEDPSLNPPANGTIYDIDPQVYLQLYGEMLPLKIDRWDI